MNAFSERFGHAAPLLDLSASEMPDGLAHGMWDTVRSCCFPDVFSEYGGISRSFKGVCEAVWFNLFRRSVDEIPRNPNEAFGRIRSWYFDGEFFRKYDFVEFAIDHLAPASQRLSLQRRLNAVLKRERAAFRLIDGLFVPITEQIEVAEVECSVEVGVAAISSHIKSALQHYSDRGDPNHRNAVKEAISAVEAAVSFVSGKQPGGVSKPLRSVIEEVAVHPALRVGYEKIYAYSSDADGIRHAMTEDGSTITQADARFMIVACSAFANLLVAKKAEGAMGV